MGKKIIKATNKKSNLKLKEDAIRFLVNKARQGDVKFIRIWFTDILGALKSFAITIDVLENSLMDGIGIDGSAIESFARSEEHDMVAIPDISTFEILPWRPSENAVARMFADIHYVNKKPFEGDPRHCLKNQLKLAKSLGYTFYVAPEIEYFYFKSSTNPEPVDNGGYFDLTPLDTGSDLRRQTVLMLEAMGISVHSSHHEVAPSQHEIGLRHMDAMTMADNVMTYRLVVKEIALKHGLHATFMPKPIEKQNGNGMHIHQSLFGVSSKGEHNAFYDAKDKYSLSKVGRSYVAGLLKHAREMAIVTNQWANSYKRLVSGYEAPTNILWGQRNRSALVRIPMYQKGKENSMRAEFRSPDPACNPYLVFSVMLAAGLRGIQKSYKLEDALEEDVTQWSADKKKRTGVTELPTNLGEAIRVAEDSAFLREALGEHITTSLIANKKIEWDQYCRHISQYEIQKDLPNL
ncbi:MAG: glutamine synthetase [Candidatus Omnitrophota bacterium]|jgi:glutamine synthetase